MRSFTDIFIKHPVLAVVVNLVIVLVGWRALTTLPVQQYPKIESSSIIITTVYYGAAAETVRGFLTTPIERVVSAISGVDYLESTSRAGVSNIVPDSARGPGKATLAGTDGKLTWRFTAQNVRDFAWASSKTFIWDAMGAPGHTYQGQPVLAMSFSLRVFGRLTRSYMRAGQELHRGNVAVGLLLSGVVLVVVPVDDAQPPALQLGQRVRERHLRGRRLR